MEKSKQGEKNTKWTVKGEKRTLGILMLEPWFVLEELRRNEIKGVVPLGQDLTQQSFQLSWNA